MSLLSELQMSKAFFATGVGLSAFTSGMIASISLVAVPGVLTVTSQSNLLTAWRMCYSSGKAIAPVLAIAATAAHATSAYFHRNSSAMYYFGFSAASTIAIVPFTLIAMLPTNNALFLREEAARGTDEKVDPEAKVLVEKWASLNLLRALLPGVGAIAALFTL